METTQEQDIQDLLSTISLGDTKDKLSIAHAVSHGYRLTLGLDGEAQVRTPEGEVYFISQFSCDCPDKFYRNGSYDGHCKHELWVFQVMPCPKCSKTMALGRFTTCFGKHDLRFECTHCGHTKQAADVFKMRQITKNPDNEIQRITHKKGV